MIPYRVNPIQRDTLFCLKLAHRRLIKLQVLTLHLGQNKKRRSLNLLMENKTVKYQLVIRHRVYDNSMNISNLYNLLNCH